MAMSIEESFQYIGARAKVVRVPIQWQQLDTPVRIDIGRDAAGEYFQIDRMWNARLSVADADAQDRHLLLLVEECYRFHDRFSLFLCGHDEKAWFVAAIPDAKKVASVADAKDALKPQEVWEEIHEQYLPRHLWNLRSNAAFIRQGEWFFLPRPWMNVDETKVLRDEPISRGGGKPHQCEYLYRIGGLLVYVNDRYPNGITEEEYWKLHASVRRRSRYWNQRTRDAEVFVRGLIRHPDHATINLPYWHKVVMNTEYRARATDQVAFLDRCRKPGC
jgi:hypothetical protein